MSIGNEIPIQGADEQPPSLSFDGWQRDKSNREYIKAVGRRGIIFRQGEETVAQALERDQQPKPQGRPQRKGANKPKTPPAPQKVDLKELEEMLANALKAPAMPAAAFGDEWAAEHFTNMGPFLARNLVLASETNPWLRRKLENAATGGDLMMQVVSLVGLGGACAMYIAPPLVWWLNLPIPEKGREMLGVPERRSEDGSPDLAAVA